MANRDVKIRLLGQDLASGAIRNVQKSLGGLGSNVAAWATGILSAGTAIAVFKSGLEGLAEEEAAVARLNAVIKSTGGAAGLSSQQIQDMASDLQRTTTFADDVTVSAAAVLATFKEIKGDTFREAMEAAQDLSAVMGQDLQSSIVQIGKALNDPVKGITALTRVGVSFTSEQKDMIKSLAETNQVMDAQKLILAELRSEFGGAAANEAKSLGGQLKQLTNDWEDLKEAMAAAAVEGGGARDLLQGMKELIKPTTLKDAQAEAIRKTAQTNPDQAQLHLDNLTKPGGLFDGNAMGVELQMAISQARRALAKEAEKQAQDIRAGKDFHGLMERGMDVTGKGLMGFRSGVVNAATMFADGFERAGRAISPVDEFVRNQLPKMGEQGHKFAELLEKAKTPAQRIREDISEVNKLLASEAIPKDAGAKLLRSLNKDLKAELSKGRKDQEKPIDLGAVESRFLTRGGTSEPPMVRELREANRIAKEELKETREQNRHLRRIAEKKGLAPANF